MLMEGRGRLCSRHWQAPLLLAAMDGKGRQILAKSRVMKLAGGKTSLLLTCAGALTNKRLANRMTVSAAAASCCFAARAATAPG